MWTRKAVGVGFPWPNGIFGRHHHSRPEESLNFKSLYDADMIVSLEERQKEDPYDSDRLADIIEKSFLSDSGRNMARDVLVNHRRE